METKDLNSIGLAYLEMVEKRNIEAKKNHAKALDKVDPEELEGDHEDRDDKDIDNDGDVDSSDEYLHKKRKAVKKAIKKDDADDQEKFKAYTGDDKNDQEGTKVSEAAKYPHMMYDPKTGKEFKAETPADHKKYEKMGYTHDKPEEIDELNKKTLGSYIKKAGPDAVKQKAQAARHSDAGDMANKDKDMYKHYAKSQRAMDKAANRQKGIGKAVDKLTREIDEAMTMVSRKPHPEGGHIVTLKDKNDKKVVRHLHNGKVKTISKESVEIDEASKEGTIRIIDLSDAHPDNRMGATEKSGFQVQRLTKGKFVNQGKPYAKKAHAEKERSTGQASMQFEAKNITTDDNALVSFYQIHSTSPRPRLAGHLNMQVLGGQHQMSAADIKNISNQAVKAGVGKMVKVDNSMLTKHIADYKNENKPAPPKIAVALSQHHAKSLGESTDLQEGAARQAAFHKGLMDYCKEIGKDHMDHKDFADHAKHVKAGNWDKARAHADDQDTEVREKIHSLAIDHLGQGAASELYGGDRVSLSKNKGDGKLHASYNESVNVDDVLALIDQGYTLDQAEAMVAEACGGGGSGGTMQVASRKHPDDKKLLKASRKQSKAGDNDRNMANDQRSIPAKRADTAPVRPGTKQNQRDFDKAARMAKSKDKVSLKPMPAALAKKMETEELHGNQHKLDHNKDGKIDAGDMKKVRKHGAVQKESVMDRVSNMVEDIRVRRNVNASVDESAGKINNPMDSMPSGGWQGSGPAEPTRVKTMSKKREKELRDAGKLSNSANNASHYAGEAVQEAAKPTAIHHSTPVTAAQANDEQAAGRWTDKAGRNTMTEKEFVDMHTIHPDVLPEFDGNVAAKKTAEAIKKAPKAVAKTPNTPTSKGDQKAVKSTEAPAANTGVVGESYMDKYAKYIRGEI